MLLYDLLLYNTYPKNMKYIVIIVCLFLTDFIAVYYKFLENQLSETGLKIVGICLCAAESS